MFFSVSTHPFKRVYYLYCLLLFAQQGINVFFSFQRDGSIAMFLFVTMTLLINAWKLQCLKRTTPMSKDSINSGK